MDNAEMIKHLVRRGASLGKLDVYRQTLRQRAYEQRCFTAMEALSSLGAPIEPSKNVAQAQIEDTIATLILEIPRANTMRH